MTTTPDKIRNATDKVRDLLLEKNRSYGDSVLNPVRVFSKASMEEQILVRVDDKISRLARGERYPGDDDVLDLAGYLILLLVARGYGDDGETPEPVPVPSEWTLRWDRDGDLWGELDGDFWVWTGADNSPGDHRQPPSRTHGVTWEEIERNWGPLEDVEASDLSRADDVARRYAGRNVMLDPAGRVWEDRGELTLYLVENPNGQPRERTATHWRRNYVERTFGKLTPVEQ